MNDIKTMETLAKIQKHNDLNRAFMIKYLQAVVIGSLNGLHDALNKPLKVEKE